MEERDWFETAKTMTATELLECIARSARSGEGVGAPFIFAQKLANMMDVRDELIEPLLAALADCGSDAAAANALLFVAKQWSRDGSHQDRFADWLAGAPAPIAQSFVLLWTPRHVTGAMAEVAASVLTNAPDAHAVQLVREFAQVQGFRAPLVRWLQRLQAHPDPLVHAEARKVLAKWS
jgi:hypothetical protein